MAEPKRHDVTGLDDAQLQDLTLTAAQFEQVMLLSDGELSGVERQAALELVRNNPQARGLLDELQHAKAAFRSQVFEAPAPAAAQQWIDNVLNQTVARADGQIRTAAGSSTAPLGLWAEVTAWLRGGVGKLALATGAVAAAAVWLVVSAGPGAVAPESADPVAVQGLPAIAVASSQGDGSLGAVAPPLGEIEELEVESGSVLVSPADDSGATVIWHFAEGQQG